ncbi:MAG: hypothetical protein M1820_000240 [Bogoriella megaspora]|nr:MAG: hypothetical protein M1820_000240 [Bogoriella megaspora]
MATLQTLPTELRLHILTYALSPYEINICSLWRSRDGWHSLYADESKDITWKKISRQATVPIRVANTNLNLLLISRQIRAEVQTLLPSHKGLDTFFCDQNCARNFIQDNYHPDLDRFRGPSAAKAKPTRTVWCRKNVRRMRYLTSGSAVYMTIGPSYGWKGTEEEAEAYMKSTLGGWITWRFVKVSMREKVEDQEGNLKFDPHIDALLENTIMFPKSQWPWATKVDLAEDYSSA